MKKSISIITAVLLALVLAISVLPMMAFVSPADQPIVPTWNVPGGYNAHDYNKLAAFLETRDENGVRNGEKTGTNYNPNDPQTWGREGNYDDPENILGPTTFTWTDQYGEKRITEVTCMTCDLVGNLDVSGCSSLASLNCAANRLSAISLNQCSALTSLICSGCGLSSLNVASCQNLNQLACDNNNLSSIGLSGLAGLRSLSIGHNPLNSLNLSSNSSLMMLNCSGCGLSSLNLSAQSSLYGLYCADNNLSSLNVSAAAGLKYLNCRNNALSSLNVSAFTTLLGLNCDGNELSSLDLSANRLLVYLSCLDNRLTSLDASATRLSFDTLTSQGPGTVACSAALYNPGGSEELPSVNNTIVASANSGSAFLGWYGQDGQLISSDAELALSASSERAFTARFGEPIEPTPTPEPGGIPGDVDGNGAVTVTDAILTLRCAMGIITLTDEQFARADVDGSNSVSVADALRILRMAMGVAA